MAVCVPHCAPHFCRYAQKKSPPKCALTGFCGRYRQFDMRRILRRLIFRFEPDFLVDVDDVPPPPDDICHSLEALVSQPGF